MTRRAATQGSFVIPECRFAPLDYSQTRRGLVADDGSIVAFGVLINSSSVIQGKLYVLNAQTGAVSFIHPLNMTEFNLHAYPSVSGRGDYVTIVQGGRVDVYTSTGETRAKTPVPIHHESLVYMDPSGDHLVHHDAPGNVHVHKWNSAFQNYTHVLVVPSRDGSGVDWHPVDWEISYGDNATCTLCLAITWVRNRVLRLQSRLTLHDIATQKQLWSWQSTRTRSLQTECTLSFHAPYIALASWSNDDSSDPQLLLLNTKSNQPVWTQKTGGSMWTVDAVVASSTTALGAVQDTIYITGAGADMHVHLPGKGQAVGYTVTLSP